MCFNPPQSFEFNGPILLVNGKPFELAPLFF